MYAPAKPDYPVISADKMPEFDAFIFGIPTRYGNMPAQWKVRRLSPRCFSKLI
jgi:NAD(P)H dehydrogenase (quinone)